MLILAPGKLFLVGEYAVLSGGPAVVAAVNRGVCCRVELGDGVETPTGDDRFVAAALTAVGAPARRYRFTDWNPTDLPDKPGFGGSAAATVAACVAGRAAAGLPFDDIESVAVATHRAVQGSGSGLDVRASARGGVRRYAPDAVPALLDAPSLLAVYSGRSASTASRVAVYRGWTRDSPDEAAAFVRDSRAIVDAFSADPVAAMGAAYDRLRAMAAAASLDYDTPALARIAALARDHGGAAKPSGAGGGDVAVAILHDPDARAAFAAACAAEGLPPIDIEVASGVDIRTSPR